MRKTRYLVMPESGIAGATMESAIFTQGAGSLLRETMQRGLNQYESFANNSFSTAESSTTNLSNHVEDADFEVISQEFADGPAVVAMTEQARLALEASLPNVRIFPITRYYLPGDNPHSRRALPAAVPAGESALLANGQVFSDDAKSHVLSGLNMPQGSGAGVVVGVVDTGVDTSHPALVQAVAMQRCLIPGVDPTAMRPVDWGANPIDIAKAGHGTHVAGIIAGRSGHGGPTGVAPEATLFDYRVFPDNGDGPKSAENAVIINTIRAATLDGCHIINLSIEGPRLKEDGVRSAIADAWEQGVLCIAAAGNGNGKPVSFPAANPHCVAVTAIGRDGAFPPSQGFLQHVSGLRSAVDPAIFLASFSNFGPRVQFTAPGHAIVSTFPNGEWWIQSGTSMAAPFISGMLARLLSANTNILNMLGDSQRSAAMLQMLAARAKVLQFPQQVYEGFGLPA